MTKTFAGTAPLVTIPKTTMSTSGCRSRLKNPPVLKVRNDNSENLVRSFMDWADNNSMKSNPSKCKELIVTKKGHSADQFTPILGISQCKELSILGVTFQNDTRFSTHVHSKLVKANKLLHVKTSSQGRFQPNRN